jgi:hypothetical protein
MNIGRTFFSFGAAALLAATFAAAPGTGFACGDKDKCACGAACPNKQMGCAEAGGCAEGANKLCACAGAAAPDANGSGEAKPEGGCQGAEHGTAPEGAAQQRAVIDPATGQLTEPVAGEAAAPGSGGIPRAVNTASAQIAQPGGGVQAAFPMDRASNAVASIDASGAAQVGCKE